MNNFALRNTGIEASLNVLNQSIMYAGDYKFSSQNTDMGDWLLCDGRSFLKAQYTDLYNVISTSFGSVDSEHFNIPDFRGRVFGSISIGHPSGQAVGTEEETLTIPQMPSHNHVATSDNNGSHNHTGLTSTNGTHSHTSNANGGYPGVGLAKSDGTNTATETDGSANELNVWSNPEALVINEAGSHNHSISTDGLHNHTINVQNTGGSLPHNNMQPTLFGGNIFILTRSYAIPYLNL
jgi:microcystin-dependent protein